MNYDKAIKVMMAVSTVVSGICAILIQLRDGGNELKINDYQCGGKKKADGIV